jgi:hypothetical protein
VWLDEDDADPKGLEAVLEGRLKLGAVTINEMRDALGLDPYANPAADRPMVLTAAGYVPIETGAEAAQTQPNQNGQKYRVPLGKYGYNPDQPRVPKHHTGGGQWTIEAGGGQGESSSRTRGGIQYASVAPPDTSRVLTGNSRIDNVTKKLAQIYAETIEKLARLPGQPQKYGTFVHAAFAAAVRAAGIDEPMDIERSFELPPGFPSWKKSVRPDIVLRDDGGDIVAIYDIKTGDSGIDPWRARELRAATKVAPDLPIVVMYTDDAVFKIKQLDGQ